MKGLINKTASIWTYVNKNWIEFINPFYSPNKNLILPAWDELSIQLWREHFLIWSETTKYKQKEDYISDHDQIEDFAKSALERELLNKSQYKSLKDEYKVFKKSWKSKKE